MFNQIGIISSQLDYDAINFCSAAGITNQTQVIALNDLCSSLKLSGVWAKCKAIYPFVGGTASTHKWNLKNPQDTDAAFRLVFSGTWTHSDNGATPDGLTAFADTKLNPRNNLDNTNLVHFSYYSRTNSAYATEVLISCSDGTGGATLVGRRASPVDQSAFQFDTNTGVATHYVGVGISTNGSGLFLGTLRSTDILMWRNNVAITLTKVNNRNINRQNRNLYIGANNNAGTANSFTNKQCAFASIGESLTDTQATDLWTAVNQFQITLGRNV